LEWAKGRVSSCIDLFGQEGLVSRSKVNLKQELFSRDLWRGPRERVLFYIDIIGLEGSLGP